MMLALTRRDPHFEAKLRDVIGLYLNPPDNAVVVCVDEKSEIQALDRTQPMLPVPTRPNPRGAATTTSATAPPPCSRPWRSALARSSMRACPATATKEFLLFLKQVAKAYPRRRLHVVCDNYATPKHPPVVRWLQANPRLTLHFTPTSSSWLSLVETFFSIISRQAIHRGSFASVADLVSAIRRFIDAWNERCGPFVWTKSADTILAKMKPQKPSATVH